MSFRRVVWIVLDSVGIGEMPDAEAYGDKGSDTLGNIARQCQLHLPNLCRLGLANIKPLDRTGARDIARWGPSAAPRWPRLEKTPPPATGKWWAFTSKSRFRCSPTVFRRR